MADNLGIMLTELPEATNIGDDDLMYIVQDNNSEKVKAKTIKDSLLGDFYGEASGNPASFADGAAAGLVECIAEIVPTQNLHGYDKPWAGGAGKNKLNVSLSRLKIINIGGTWSGNTYSVRGVTFEVTASDGVTVDSIKANGTASGGQAYMIIADAQMLTMESDEEYILSNDTNGYAESVYNGSSSSASTTGTLTFTFSGFTSGWNMTIGVPNGATATDVIFRPMVRKSSVSDATFEPYANICPISGSTSVTVTVSDGETSTTKTTALGQMVYGGQLNVLTGELTIDKNIITLDGSESWNDNATINGFTLYNKLYVTSSRAHGISDRFKIITEYGSTEMGLILGLANKHIYASHITDNLSGISSVSDWKTWLSNNNVSIVCEITPQTVQLTPQEVNSLLGQNNISADTGDVDIIYVKASAPIKPNPSGEADGYLSSIELSGEKFEIIKELPAFPSSNGNYKLKLSVSSGVPTLSWVSDT